MNKTKKTPFEMIRIIKAIAYDMPQKNTSILTAKRVIKEIRQTACDYGFDCSLLNGVLLSISWQEKKVCQSIQSNPLATVVIDHDEVGYYHLRVINNMQREEKKYVPL